MTNQVGSVSWAGNRLTSRRDCDTRSFKVRSEGCPRSGLRQPFRTMGDSDRSALMALSQRLSAKLFARFKGLTPNPFAMNLWVSMEDEGALTSTEEAFHRSLAPSGETY